MQANQANDSVTAWKSAAATVLDVRPELAQGGEPFVHIMEAAETVPAGASLVLIAPFEPAPLYAALSGRGFSHATQCVASDEWVVRFTRDQ
ncbi:MAG TPA: DUF2249 domain-containing protein [Ktedonobacterales bacterium]|nr:DUF2249 domain-containing protein [Ktedonobacterales bacterium]